MKTTGSQFQEISCQPIGNAGWYSLWFRMMVLSSKDNMKQLLYAVTVLLVMVFSGCSDIWNEHYNTSEDDKVVSPLSLLEYLKTKPEYSVFVEALESTGVAEELMRDQNLTVWAITNEAMAELQSVELFTDTFVMQYHINNLAVGKNKLFNGQRIPALNGKYIQLYLETDGAYVNESKITLPDQFCQNGVVHQVDKLLLPRISIYEYLMALGDEYSMIVDSIFNQNDTVFDPVNSKPIGVDSEGRTIYDSIFVIENPIFKTVDFRSEFEQTTMFLPSNSVIEICYQKLEEQLTAIGKTYTYADQLMAFNWLKGALFYNGLVDDYGSVVDLTSVENKIWRTTVQQVNATPVKMSNGLIYETTFVKIPNNQVLTRLKGLAHYYEFIPEAERDALIQFINCTLFQPKTADGYNFASTGGPVGNYKVLKASGANPTDELKLAVEFSPLKIQTLPDNTILATEMLIPAGEYRLYMGFQEKNHPYISIYFNNQLLSADIAPTPATPWNYDRTDVITGKSRIWDGTGGLVGLVQVPGNDLEHVKIRVEFSRLRGGTAEELNIYHWLLVPTANNY
jgi:uncharacterized surface protein with fasciclin (FAS1) repeats